MPPLSGRSVPVLQQVVGEDEERIRLHSVRREARLKLQRSLRDLVLLLLPQTDV